jgi:hypothetical protein
MPDAAEIDHINTNGLDCRRSNLRAASHAQNGQNKRANSNNTSGFKGVSKTKTGWEARVGFGGKRIFLGTFPDPASASLAYAEAAKRLFGDFSRTAWK